DSFWELFDCGEGPKTFLGIVTTNGFGRGSDDETVYRVYNMGSRFNHSCLPNVCASVQDDGLKRDCYVLRDVKAGEELCVTYITDNDLPRRERQMSLMDTWRFECACEVCSLSPEAQAQSDENRREFKKCRDTSFKYINMHRVKEAYDVCLRQLQLAETEFRADPTMMHLAYNDLFQVAAAKRNGSLVMKYLQLAYQNCMYCYGPKSDITMRVAAIVKDPQSSAAILGLAAGFGPCSGLRGAKPSMVVPERGTNMQKAKKKKGKGQRRRGRN
ncbi:hypothetical protein KIPB_002645, partial [Kipferlia bialata]